MWTNLWRGGSSDGESQVMSPFCSAKCYGRCLRVSAWPAMSSVHPKHLTRRSVQLLVPTVTGASSSSQPPVRGTTRQWRRPRSQHRDPARQRRRRRSRARASPDQLTATGDLPLWYNCEDMSLLLQSNALFDAFQHRANWSVSLPRPQFCGCNNIITGQVCDR